MKKRREKIERAHKVIKKRGPRNDLSFLVINEPPEMKNTNPSFCFCNDIRQTFC